MTALDEQNRAHLDRQARLGLRAMPKRPPLPLMTGAFGDHYVAPLAAERKRRRINYAKAAQMVCDHTDVPDLMIRDMQCHHHEVIAARHMLWTVLFDGGHAQADIGQCFGVSAAEVRVGVVKFRSFMADRRAFERSTTVNPSFEKEKGLFSASSAKDGCP